MKQFAARLTINKTNMDKVFYLEYTKLTKVAFFEPHTWIKMVAGEIFI